MNSRFNPSLPDTVPGSAPGEPVTGWAPGWSSQGAARGSGLWSALPWSLLLAGLSLTGGFGGTVRAASYGEAPELARAVAQGKLPPVEQRLPRNPMLVQPVERVGEYGGTFRSALMGWGDLLWLDRTIGYEPLVRWDPEWTRLVPGVAQSYEVNSTATEFTFHLRRGMRWSDGAPFTADDILFWHDAIFRPNLLGQMPEDLAWCVAGGKPGVVAKQDDFTATFRFAAPNGLFLYGLAGYRGHEPNSFPRHHLAQFHAAYNPDGIGRLVAEAGLTNWVDLFKRQVGYGETVSPKTCWRSAAIPTLNAWQLVEGVAFDQRPRTVARRNPYYWKVDTAGNQLPYLDQIVYLHPKDTQELLGLARAGDLDLYERRLTSPEFRPALETSRVAGNYRFYRILQEPGNTTALSLNLNHPEEAKRRLYQNQDFRIGLSHAIDRRRIIREAVGPAGRPYQVAPRPESPYYHQRLATQYTDYDPVRAAALLDRAGLGRRDGAGWRLGTDGQRITVTGDVSRSHPMQLAILNVIKTNWAAVGIDLHLQAEDWEILYARKQQNRHDLFVWTGDGGLDVLMDPRYYLPFNDESVFAVAWARWRIDPRDPLAQEPPAPARRQMQLYAQLGSTPDLSRQKELMSEILDIAAEQFYAIGVCLPPDSHGLVKNRVGNMPRLMATSGRSFLSPAPVNPCQFFLKAPANQTP